MVGCKVNNRIVPIDHVVATGEIIEVILGPAEDVYKRQGKHFPDTDPAYAGADSLQLAQHVARIMREKGWKIVNICLLYTSRCV